MTAVEVVVLTQPDCGYCDQAKDTLSRLGDEFDLTVREVALDSADGRRLAEGARVMFPPGVLLGGEPFSYGRLSERKLRRELRRRAD